MDRFTESDTKAQKSTEIEAEAETGTLSDPERRKFSRGALASGAVLLSLGNRPAWGVTVGCMSVATVNSFDPKTGMFISAPAGRPTHNEDLAAEIHRIADAPTFQGTDGKWSTCPDPQSLDGVCLVKGKCKP